MPPIIEIKSLNKSFDAVSAVKDLTFNVEQGEIFGLVGPDGAGKTTTVRMTAGVMSLDSGSISVKGRTLWSKAFCAGRYEKGTLRL